MHSPYPAPLQVHHQHLLRHRCRNPRCGGKLKIPTPNKRDAFCCRGCFKVFYRQRCLVCEQPFTRKNERQRICRRAKCQSARKRPQGLFLSSGYLSASVSDIPIKNPTKPGLKNGTKPGRALRIIAGPAVPEINLAIPLDPAFVARLARHHAQLAEQAAVIGPDGPPANIIGGYRFPNAPAINLNFRGSAGKD
jgi:hypothetical protein